MTIQHVLALDIAGNPFEWLAAEDAVTLYAKGKVAWELGGTEKIFRGGHSRAGVQSAIVVKPIIAIAGSEMMARNLRHDLPLGDRDNDLLFRRDRNMCAYCGLVFARHLLTRDHILARSRGGRDDWMNVATACHFSPPEPLPVQHDFHRRRVHLRRYGRSNVVTVTTSGLPVVRHRHF
jgi:hypothetical protein